MCEVMDRAEQRGIKRGEKIGEERGIKLGEERGIKLGEMRGADSARLEDIRNLMKNAQWTAEKAMENLGIDRKEFPKYKDMLQM